MFEKAAIKRIMAILLAMVMVLSVPGYASAFEIGQEADEGAFGYEADDSSGSEAQGDAEINAAKDADIEDQTENDISDGKEDLFDNGAKGSDDATEIMETEESAAAPESDVIEPADNTEEGIEPEPESLPEIRINAAGEDGTIVVVWSAVDSAEYYIVRLDGNSDGTKVIASENTVLKTVFKSVTGTNHSITVEAYCSHTSSESETILIGRGTIDNVSSSSRNKITKKNIAASKLAINLRKLLGEPHNGYAVVQGACTDGTFAYSMMTSSYTQKGRILKTVAGTGTVVARSNIINICHGNGMALNTKERKLVVNGRKSRRNQLTVINADNLSDVSYVNVDYSYPGYWNNTASNGISNIAYVEKYNCYITVQRKTHELLILDNKFRVIGQAGTKITADYPGIYQAMDADERYVYLVLSYHSSKQPYNIVLVLDWNSENLLDVLNGNKAYIGKRWLCNNNGSGKPDTVIRINTPYEAENIYHINQKDGTSHFYLSEYHNNPKYHWVTKTKIIRVKWKKVKKRVRVKWKRVRKNGKWKWKYKYKWKKVWKYKKKKKKYKVREFKYLNRDNYVYDLGSF